MDSKAGVYLKSSNCAQYGNLRSSVSMHTLQIFHTYLEARKCPQDLSSPVHLWGGVLWMGLQLQSTPQYCNDSWSIAGTLIAGKPAWIQSPISAHNGPRRPPGRHDWTRPTSLWPACWWGARGGQLHIWNHPQWISCSLERGGQRGHSSQQVHLLMSGRWALYDYRMPVPQLLHPRDLGRRP